jgi:hypothetical protein
MMDSKHINSTISEMKKQCSFLKPVHEWKNIILSEVSQNQKAKGTFCLICGVQI